MFRALPIILFLTFALPQISFSAPAFAKAVTNGIVNISNLTEASGVAASRNNPGVLWTENDSGNAAVVYAIDSQGRNLGTYTLPGNTDNEDIGIGPGPVTNVSYLYVTDIGDNNSDRANIAIYQTPEPAVYFWQTNNPVSSRAMKGTRTIFLTYPDGPHNAEAEFIDPVTGDWFVLTKSNITSQIYTAPKALLDTINQHHAHVCSEHCTSMSPAARTFRRSEMKSSCGRKILRRFLRAPTASPSAARSPKRPTAFPSSARPMANRTARPSGLIITAAAISP